MTMIWCMVPEISCATDRIFCHFGLFFLPLYLPLKQHEKSKCWKNEKNWRYLHLSTINENHMMYDSWDMEHDRKNLADFRPFLITQRIKILKTWMKHLVISSFYTSVPKIMIICYTAPEIWHIADIIVIFHFGLFLLFYSLSSPKNENLKTMKKTPEDNIILQKCTKNHDHMLYCSWDICCVTDVNVIFILGYFLPFYHSNSPKNQSFKKTNKKTKKKTPGDIILHICTKNYD